MFYFTSCCNICIVEATYQQNLESHFAGKLYCAEAEKKNLSVGNDSTHSMDSYSSTWPFPLHL